jgi:tRNA1(Val) A37 N6-methylase TrmN6
LTLSFIANETLAGHDQFRINFFTNLQKAVEQNTVKQGVTFLNTKTADAITFLQLITQKYEIAVANPPYTDSSDFGPELKTFIEDNYKKPHKFHSNLYATFIKRCYELIDDRGKMAIDHRTLDFYMYIKTFEEVRKFILEKLHIKSVCRLWGYSGMFNPWVDKG